MIAALVALASTVVSAQAPQVQRFAVVVGHNEPTRPDLARLRYADDDAVRWTVLLRTFGVETTLLTVLDEDSRTLYADAAVPTGPPTRAALLSSLDAVMARARKARSLGAEVAFFFVYAGHGDSDAGQGYVALVDGRFTRDDLETEILARSPAHANHVVIDACRSYYMAFDRGPGGRRRPWTGPYFHAGTALRFPNTGFLLASSTEAPTHEWEEFQAGVFSHEVRSGLLGGADANRDGRITYDEVAAFVRVANRKIRNERFRPQMFAHAPRGGDGVLLSLSSAAGGVLRSRGASGRLMLEDQLGVRWADLHPAAGQPFSLRLPSVAWSQQRFFLRPVSGEREWRVPAAGASDLESLVQVAASVTPRGAAHEAFRTLFAEPFDAASVTAESALHVERLPAPDREGPGTSAHRTGWALLAGGTAALTAAGALSLAMLSTHQDGSDPDVSGQRRAELNHRLAAMQRWRMGTLVAGGLLGGGGALLLLLTQGRPGVTVAPLPGGAALSLRGDLR